MRIACWTPETTDQHSEYVILIAYPLQQWLYEWASMLRYTYVACLFILLQQNKNFGFIRISVAVNEGHFQLNLSQAFF